jgi:monoamine oxidase
MNDLHRRDFLKLSGLALTEALSVYGARGQARPTKKVIVAGAGIGGLCCGYELMKRGHEVIVLEASGRAGGHVRTIRDPLADGLYADAGAEHFTVPGYDLYRGYVKEFDLPTLLYPRRDNILRFIEGKMYTEEMLADPGVLKKLGLNQREIDYLVRHPWWELPMLYLGPYLDSFENEYQPFNAKLNHLDSMRITDLLKRDGASTAALRAILGSSFFENTSSALHIVWHAAILKLRGVPFVPPKLYRIKGGNQLMTDTFAARLGERLRLGCPVTGIEHGKTGVTVRYLEFGQEKKIEGDYLVCCMSLVMLRRLPVSPDWPADRSYIIRNMPYLTVSRVILQSRTPFWSKDEISANIEFSDLNLYETWRTAEEIQTSRGLLLGGATASTSAEQALKAFRKYYPGKSEDIEQAIVVDWGHDPWAMACERIYYSPGELPRYWPKVIEPHGRIHFAGAYADNLSWGQEAATRSANRVAEAIDQA